MTLKTTVRYSTNLPWDSVKSTTLNHGYSRVLTEGENLFFSHFLPRIPVVYELWKLPKIKLWHFFWKCAHEVVYGTHHRQMFQGRFALCKPFYAILNSSLFHFFSVPAVFTVFLLIYENTFFTASLSLHHRRVIGKYELKQPNTGMGSSLEEPPRDSALADCNLLQEGKMGGRFNKLELMVKKWLPRLVLNNGVRVGATAFVIFLIFISTFQVRIEKIFGNLNLVHSSFHNLQLMESFRLSLSHSNWEI